MIRWKAIHPLDSVVRSLNMRVLYLLGSSFLWGKLESLEDALIATSGDGFKNCVVSLLCVPLPVNESGTSPSSVTRESSLIGMKPLLLLTGAEGFFEKLIKMSQSVPTRQRHRIRPHKILWTVIKIINNKNNDVLIILKTTWHLIKVFDYMQIIFKPFCL